MARSVGTTIQNSFVQGVVTQASGMNFPENACTDALDCVFHINGTVEARPGFDFETNYLTHGLTRNNRVVTSYLWKGAGGDGNTNLLVLQVGEVLTVYDASGQSIGAQIFSTGLVEETGAPPAASAECQFAAGQGYLFITHPYVEAFFLTYAGGTVTRTHIQLLIRDFEGIDESALGGVDFRPAGPWANITNSHVYNLLNQGWNDTNAQAFTGAIGLIPSNADVMADFKGATGAFDTTTVPNRYRGNSPAPKGHYTLNLYNQDRGAVASQSGITPFTTLYHRCAAVTFFQGRVLYAGLNYPGYNGNIYFSPIIQSANQFGLCYQANDPTSDTAFDLLPDDGGVIKIQEAGTIIKLFTVPGGLLVFALNGVWLISGSTGLGFTASDYNIAKISSIGALTASSFIDAAGMPMWWNADGIYAVAPTAGGGMAVQNLTMSTIQDLYDQIPLSSKKTARGDYNPVTGLVQWLYNSTNQTVLDLQYQPDRILNFNTRTNAFYQWSASGLNVKMHSAFVLPQVDAAVTGGTVIHPRVKYVVSYGGNAATFTFADLHDTTHWADWFTFDSIGVPLRAYLVSGYKVHGDGLRKFQPEYIRIFTRNSIETKYDFQARWDYANSGSTGRWSAIQRVSHSGIKTDYSMKRLKVRGNGAVLQFKITQVPSFPFKLAGWTSLETVNSAP